MIGELPQDIIGTNPKYPSLVNHDWLTIDVNSYDNYPSDNNPVRVVPKLSDMWGHKADTGINLVPNLTVQTLGRNADEKSKEETVSNIIREAKKAMMVGISGKDLADHLRARFAHNQLISAKEHLEKLAEEQGLLGNVYIDASAFSSAKEMEQFINNNRTRLAQDIVVNNSNLNTSVIGVLASRFHKNVVASVSYNDDTFNKYKSYLVDAGKIDRDFVVNSKETLRKAFLSKKEIKEPQVVKAEKKIDVEAFDKDMSLRIKMANEMKQAADEEILFRKIRPILEYAREHLAKGKTGSDLKEMLRSRYATGDLRDSAKYLALVISNDGLSSEAIDKVVTSKEMSEMVGEELKKLGKKFPVKARDVYEHETNRTIGVKGYFHALSGKTSNISDEIVKSAVADLRSGLPIEKAFVNLRQKMSSEEAEKTLERALREFNSSSAGIKANVFTPAPKQKVVADIEEKVTLPDPSTIPFQSQEILSFFEGSNKDFDVGSAPEKQGSLEIEGIFNRSGLDSVL